MPERSGISAIYRIRKESFLHNTPILVLTAYANEELRRDGKHDKPALEGVRLYRVSWELDPWARNIATPNRKDLIFEVKHHSP